MKRKCTPNGYDPRWVEAINGVLADRDVDVRIEDLTEDLWERFIGPMADAIEEEHDAANERVTDGRSELLQGIESLLGCCELNVEDLEPETVATIARVRELTGQVDKAEGVTVDERVANDGTFLTHGRCDVCGKPDGPAHTCPGCPECQRSFGPHYRGTCSHSG